MVFKGRFFSSRHKSSDSSSPDGSNSPRTPTSAPGSASAASPASSSSSRSDKKKTKSETPRKRDKLFGSASVAIPKSAASSASSSPAGDGRKGPSAAQLRDAGGGASAAALSPILASSLGLNRIKTRSGPLPQEGQRIAAALGSSNLSRGQAQAEPSAASVGGRKGGSSWADSSSSISSSRGKGKAAELPMRSATGASSGAEGKSAVKGSDPAPLHFSFGKFLGLCSMIIVIKMLGVEIAPFILLRESTKSSALRNHSGDLRTPTHIPEAAEVIKVIQVKFEKAKEEVNSDLAVFAGELVSIMEKYADSHPEWKETLEDLLILARSCCVMTAGEFWLQCEGIVQDLDDHRQELPMGVLKKLYTRMLFILTRCTRLLQFHKESGFAEDEVVIDQRDKIIQSADRQVLAQPGAVDTNRACKSEARKSYSQEQRNMKWKRSQEIKPVKLLPPLDTDAKKEVESPPKERMSSWKPFPSPVTKSPKESTPTKEESPDKKTDALLTISSHAEQTSPVDSVSQHLPPKHQHKTSWGHWSDQPNISEEGSIMCRICEEYVPTHYVEDHSKIVELADIARCIANTPLDEESALSQMVTCIEDLQEIVNRRKHEALTVQTFGTRIEKLHREKYLQLCDSVDMDKIDSASTIMDEEDDVVRSLRASPVHPVKDRTSIDDFEIIKPISRGAFGRVFLAKKRTTGDLFAIKVLRKADMIRKNAVESILAERDILITVRNPFVVRFFYSFTSRDNLYLVMEYLNGGDLYSLLRNLGCLDEDVARVYLAEVVLALEYLHSMQIVHRDLKPDNLLIAHDGHIKLTDFGLSKVGLINSTDDLSGPAVSGASFYGEDEPQMSEVEQVDHRERRQNRSAVGTPDYLAPEILLGTGHGASADWWSVGVILFELIVGIPPFNAEHPQNIFDNILNRKIPWPHVPKEMSFEARDLIDKLLTEDPQRLGANGASEVKQHPFFKDISWDTLARQKAAFVPSSDSAFDTSYFTSRYSWNTTDENLYEAYEFEDSSDNGSLSGSSSCVSNRQDDMNLSQLASINYDLLTKGLKDDPPPKSET
ncbi:hypothetical protein PR202_ga13208 [Eleusine coracana subsp. coracana]|uniref:non-specific serine/threonine protein kinase n=1 Tax=Eleusine coracana subsp. coracana TaxID=191504 RepID=A0AAV5CE45_ELECO|nr:hypothetical protein PR202_ga13208 [Eleusine coracana subsp. coracana]